MSAKDLNETNDHQVTSPRSVLAMYRTGIVQEQLTYIPEGEFIKQHTNKHIGKKMYEQHQAIRKLCIQKVVSERNNIVSNGILEEEQIMFPQLPQSLAKKEVQLDGFLRYAAYNGERRGEIKTIQKKDQEIWQSKQQSKEEQLQQQVDQIKQKCVQRYNATTSLIESQAEEQQHKIQQRKKYLCDKLKSHQEQHKAAIQASLVNPATVYEPIERARNNKTAADKDFRLKFQEKNQQLAQKQQEMQHNRQMDEQQYVKEKQEVFEQTTHVWERATQRKLDDFEQKHQLYVNKEQLIQNNRARSIQIKNEHEQNTKTLVTQKLEQLNNQVIQCKTQIKNELEQKIQQQKQQVSSVLNEKEQIDKQEINNKVQRLEEQKQRFERTITQKEMNINDKRDMYIKQQFELKQKQLESIIQKRQQEFQLKLTAVRLGKPSKK